MTGAPEGSTERSSGEAGSRTCEPCFYSAYPLDTTAASCHFYGLSVLINVTRVSYLLYTLIIIFSIVSVSSEAASSSFAV